MYDYNLCIRDYFSMIHIEFNYSSLESNQAYQLCQNSLIEQSPKD